MKLYNFNMNLIPLIMPYKIIHSMPIMLHSYIKFLLNYSPYHLNICKKPSNSFKNRKVLEIFKMSI